ncbi:MAG: hypothetical protein AAGA23_05825 [Pseudomonadota bacterium]
MGNPNTPVSQPTTGRAFFFSACLALLLSIVGPNAGVAAEPNVGLPIACAEPTLLCAHTQRYQKDPLGTGVEHVLLRYFDWPQDGGNLNRRDLEARAERALKAKGDRSPDYALALAEFAASQLLAGEPARAAGPLRKAVTVLEQSTPVDDERRIGPYALLGAALTGLGKPEDGLDMVSRAGHVTRLKHGAADPEQLPFMVMQSALLWQADEAWKAEQVLRGAQRIARETFGVRSAEAAASTFLLGAWLTARYQFDPAATVFRDALIEMANAHGQQPPEATVLLLGQANNFLASAVFRRGFDSLTDLTKLLDQHRDTFGADQLIEAHVYFGDQLMLRYFERAAVGQYRAAWQLAEANQENDWLNRLAQPELVTPGMLAGSSRGMDGSGSADLSVNFVIRADGRPGRIRVAQSNMTARETGFAKKLFRNLRFRPALVDGAAVAQVQTGSAWHLLLAPPRTPAGQRPRRHIGTNVRVH